MFIQSLDLQAWANRRDSQGMLPKVIRRLVLATTEGVRRAEFRAGEGVQVSGWDGIVDAEKGHAHVPLGLSAWELSVERDSKGKADDDYDKRLAAPLGVDPMQATFVFVTPRRWSAKNAWVADKLKENKWRDVRAYDADDLEAWLESAPSVHIWISILLGKHPEGAESLDAHWDGWISATDPSLSAELVLAGRSAVFDEIRDWFLKPTATIAIYGETRDEALAIFAASVQSLELEKREAILTRAIIVRDLQAWNRLCVAGEGLLLVQKFACAEATGRAVKCGHSCVVLLGQGDKSSSHAIDIPRISRVEAAKALTALGVSAERSAELAALARRSFTSLRRKISLVPQYERPPWARPENARSLVPALLVGRWSGSSEGDRGILATVGGKAYESLHEEFVRWSNDDDPPLRCINTTWYLTSDEDAWSLLGRYLTEDDLRRFVDVAIDVLSRSDPSFDLPEERRWMAGVIGPRSPHSGILKTGIANSLAIMGAREEAIKITGEVTVAGWADLCVRKILDTSNWKVWASLPLRALAEASPDEFLSAVDNGLRGPQPPFIVLFRGADADLFTSSPHVELLWALETLAWSEDYLVRAVAALARLAELDPGGKTGNTPLRSLRSIFLLWYPQTASTLDRRLAALDSLRSRFSEIAWKLMTAILPRNRDHSDPTVRPTWRGWAPDGDVRVSRAEHAKGVLALVDRMIQDVGSSGARWSDLLEALPQLPRDAYEAVFAKLTSLTVDALGAADRALIWGALRALVSRHRSLRNAEWSLPEDEVNRIAGELGRFEPLEAPKRYGWLFGDNPTLPEGREEDWEAYHQLVAQRQCEAVQTMYEARRLDWLPEMIEFVERPDLLGAALSRCPMIAEIEDELLQEYLRPDDPRYHRFCSGFIHARSHVNGVVWASQKLEAIGTEWTPDKRAAFCVGLPFGARTWQIVDGCDKDTVAKYWQTAGAFYVDEDAVEVAVAKLTEHGRSIVAINLLQHHVCGGKVPVRIVAEVLESFLSNEAREPGNRRLSAHDLSDLLEYVAASDEIDEGRIARLEWAFLPALGRHVYTPKVLHRELARSPAFFVEVVALVYRAEGEEARELSPEEHSRWKRAYELLEAWRWRPLPGMPERGEFDPVALQRWVQDAREKLASAKRLSIGEYTIGQVLSCAPSGDDGAWPHPAVRDMIEELASDDFEQGLITGLLNSEGVSSRSLDEGGKRERNIADNYDRFSKMVGDRWGRTAAMLRRIKDCYLARAKQEDQRRDLRDELE